MIISQKAVENVMYNLDKISYIIFDIKWVKSINQFDILILFYIE